MGIRFILLMAAALLGCALYYVASPLIAAHQLHTAIRTADSAAVQRMVLWRPLRISIKQTVARNAKLLPAARDVARRASTSWWQRIRSAMGHSMLDRFIERYITPKGLSELYRQRNTWHRSKTMVQRVSFERANVDIGSTLTEVWSKIRRAEFMSFMRFELETRDRFKPNRWITSAFQLTNIGLGGIEWKLVGVTIRDRQAGPKSSKANLAKLNGF